MVDSRDGKFPARTKNKLKHMKFSHRKILTEVEDNGYTCLHFVDTSISNIFNITDLAAYYHNSKESSQIKVRGIKI